MELKEAVRIPTQLDLGYLFADMYGATHQEQQENGAKEMEMLETAALYFRPDTLNNPGPALAVGDRMTSFPAIREWVLLVSRRRVDVGGFITSTNRRRNGRL
jgi:hypothetical protein